MLPNVWKDLRYAARSLSRNPGFTSAAVVTIALGVGVNAGVFTVISGVLLRDLPAPDAHELVSFHQSVEGGEFTAVNGAGTFTISEYRAYRRGAETLSGILAHGNPTETTLGGEAPRRISGALVSCNYFAVLESPPVLGRALRASDCTSSAAPVVVLGHALWQRTFGADPDIVGRTVELNRQLFTVVGVAAESMYGGSPIEAGYFAPVSTEPLLDGRSRFEDEQYRWLYLIGRRSDGASLEQARAELGVVAARIDEEDTSRSTSLTIDRATPMTIPEPLRGAATGAAAVLMIAFGCILLIACANVANLLLARGTARSREIGIRLSLGATRGHIVRQLLTESMLISIVGGVVGCLLALWSFQVLVALAVPAVLPPEFPELAYELDLSPDFRVFAFSATLTLVTGIIFGLAPALTGSRPDLVNVIKQDSAGGGSYGRGRRLRATLVGIQVALSMCLIVATALLLRGLYATYTVDPGIAYRDVVFVSFGTEYGPDEVMDRRLMDEIRALPGVEEVAYTWQTPLGESTIMSPIRLPGESDNERRFAELDGVTPEYFSLLELPIVRGRAFTRADSANVEGDSGVRPVIVSEATARNLWGEADPLGRTLLRGEVTLQVVGVAADAQLTSLGTTAPYYIYEPHGSGGVLLVKSQSDVTAISSSIREIISGRDPGLAFRILPLEANVAWWRGLSVIVTSLATGLGVLALVLASVGIYGVVAYAVTRRYREIGIRMALGASARSVLARILRETMRPVALGAVVGLAGAWAASGILSAVLFGVSPTDPIGLGGGALLVLGVAFAAGILGARSATRGDPTTALHYE